MADFDLNDLVDHPHNRGEFTQGEWLRFLWDWEQSEQPRTPKGLLDFAGKDPYWRDFPVQMFINTVRSMSEVPEHG